MTIKRSILNILLAMLIILPGCASNGGSIGVQADQPPSATLPPTTPSEATYFPVQKDGFEALAYPAALASGVLVLDQGSLRLKPANDLSVTADKALIIWPPGSSLQVENGTIQVLNQGKVVARLGETLRIGGGQVPPEIVEKYTGQAPPLNCPGPYWLASPGVYYTPQSTFANSPTLPVMDDEFKAAMEKEPLLLDATIYAQHSGVSVDEALRRLKLQGNEAVSTLRNTLEVNEPATFGGLWLQHEPRYRIVLAFTQNGEAILQKYADLVTPEIEPYIEVRTVELPLAELLQKQIQIGSSLQDLAIPFNSAVYVMENQVGVTVSESMRARVEEAIQSGNLVIPDGVKINYAKGLAFPA